MHNVKICFNKLESFGIKFLKRILLGFPKFIRIVGIFMFRGKILWRLHHLMKRLIICRLLLRFPFQPNKKPVFYRKYFNSTRSTPRTPPCSKKCPPCFRSWAPQQQRLVVAPHSQNLPHPQQIYLRRNWG